jgi:mannosylglucosylglycerate synthase
VLFRSWLKDDDIFILQPTRVIARKGIEHSIELIARLNNKKAKLVITHQAKDEGKEYLNRIVSYAKLLKVELIIRPNIIGNKRGLNENGSKIYTLWDLYPHADFITYPSTYEGFGNAFLETIYFKKPLLVNRYSIYQRDIEHLGFDVVTMETYINDDIVKQVKEVLNNKEKRDRMTQKNFELGGKYFSYNVLKQNLKTILICFEGNN